METGQPFLFGGEPFTIGCGRSASCHQKQQSDYQMFHGGFLVSELTLAVTLLDGTETSATVDVDDFSDLTPAEAMLAGQLAGVGGLINPEGEVEPTPEGIAAFIFVKALRDLEGVTPDDFEVFRDALLEEE